jgi:hypothetical protein
MKIEPLQEFVLTAKSKEVRPTFTHDLYICDLVIPWLKMVFDTHNLHDYIGFLP